MNDKILRKCQRVFPTWSKLSTTDFHFDAAKGFSTFTLGIRCKKDVYPNAVFYRHLQGKENAILDYDTEKHIYLSLAEHNIAAKCLYYDNECRIELFYQGQTLSSDDLFDNKNLKKIARQLYKFHQLKPKFLPKDNLFYLIHSQWGELAKDVLENKFNHFPENEQQLARELKPIYSNQTLEKIKRILPKSELCFCHNDTYHGNIMKLENGDIKLLDFEFSCLNYRAYDFSNLFAETVMQHQQSDYPYFKIIPPRFNDEHLAKLINFYLENGEFESIEFREKEYRRLLSEAKNLLLLSDFKYAMAAIVLAVEPVQNIRFIPYAHQRYNRFLTAYKKRFNS